MLNLSNLKPRIKRKPRKRVGRGGSHGGTYAGRGLKGQKARSGGRIKPGFEGGRMPFVRQLPKARGFRSPYRKSQVVDLAALEAKFQNGEIVSPAILARKGLIRDAAAPVKILGGAKLSKKFEFKQVKMSAAAREAAAAAGGKFSDDR